MTPPLSSTLPTHKLRASQRQRWVWSRHREPEVARNKLQAFQAYIYVWRPYVLLKSCSFSPFTLFQTKPVLRQFILEPPTCVSQECGRDLVFCSLPSWPLLPAPPPPSTSCRSITIGHLQQLVLLSAEGMVCYLHIPVTLTLLETV